MIDEQVRYGTRWSRAGVAVIAAALTSAGLGWAMVQGAIASTFTATELTGAVSISEVRAGGLGVVVKYVPAKHADGTVFMAPVTRFGIREARASELCVAEKATVLGQKFTVLIKGGDGDPSTDEIEIQGAILDAALVNANIELRGPSVANKNGASVDVPGSPITLDGAPDQFGLGANSAVLKNVTGQIQSITLPAGLATPKLDIRLVPGEQTCPPPIQPAR